MAAGKAKERKGVASCDEKIVRTTTITLPYFPSYSVKSITVKWPDKQPSPSITFIFELFEGRNTCLHIEVTFIIRHYQTLAFDSKTNHRS